MSFHIIRSRYLRMISVVPAVCLFSSTLVVAGCGKKGPPHPPESADSLQVGSLTGKASVDSILLNWSEPKSAGRSLGSKQSPSKGSGSIVRYEVYRSAGRGVAESDFLKLAEISARQTDGSASTEGLASARAFLDRGVKPGLTYRYQVRAVSAADAVVTPTQVLKVTFRGETSLFESEAVSSAKKANE